MTTQRLSQLPRREQQSIVQLPSFILPIIVMTISLCWAALLGHTCQRLGAAEPIKVNRCFPSGGQIGRTHEITLSGSMPTWPVQAWTSSPELTIEMTESSGKIRLTVADSVLPGVYYFRLFNQDSATRLLPLIIDRCADLLEVEPNDHHRQAQVVETSPIAIHGCLEKAGDVDTYRVALKQGQTMVASLDAERYLRSPMDADMQILSEGGSVLMQQFDHHGLDPETRFTAPKDGNYLVRLMAFPETPNSTIAYAGAENYLYRLTLTTGPALSYTMPACLLTQSENRLQLFGANLAEDQRIVELPPATLTTQKHQFFSVPHVQGILQMPVSSHVVFVETEPNDATAPQSVTVPAVFSGVIQSPGDEDRFQFQCSQGQRWKIQLEARTYGSQLDAVLSIHDSAGKQLATADDVGENRDPVHSFVAPSEGVFSINVRDMFREGSGEHWYRVLVEPEVADFNLTTTTDVFVGKINQPLEIPVSVQRTLDFAEDIAVGLEQSLNGSEVPVVVSKKSDDSGKLVKLVLQTDKPYSGPIRIVGHSPERASQQFAAPDKYLLDWLWLTITP